MPRVVIFEVSVCRGRPSLTAAPAGPDTWPRHTVMYPRAADHGLLPHTRLHALMTPPVRGIALMLPLFSSPWMLLGLLWFWVMLHAVWPSRGALSPPMPAEPEPITPTRTHAIAPTP